MSDVVNAIAGAAAEALLNGLWQGIALAVLAGGLLRAARPCNAATRYAVWYATLAVVVCLPVILAGGRLLAPQAVAVRDAIAAPVFDQGVLERGEDKPISKPRGLSYGLPHFRIALPDGNVAIWLAGIWLAIAAVLMARLMWGYRCLLRLKHTSVPLAGIASTTSGITRRRVQLRASEDVPMPLVAGLIWPAILFPAALTGKLTREEIYRIWLHEMAHIRRWDDWTKLGQRLAEALMFFHPAVWWIGRRLNLEREIASDDWVVAVSGAPRPYAACLTKLAQLAWMRAQPSPAPGMVSGRKHIFRRIEMLLDRRRNPKPFFSKAVLAVSLAAFFAASLLFALMTPVISLAEMPPAATAALIPQQAQEQSKQADQMKQLADQMRPMQEEIRKLADQIRKEVQTEIRPHTEQIHKLTEQIHEEVKGSIQPSTEEIRRLAEQMRQEHESGQPDPEKIRALENQMRSIERDKIQQAEERVRALEQKIRAIETDSVRRAETRIRDLEGKIRELEQRMRLKDREMRRLEQKIREAQPPAPPAPPAAAPAPPAPAAAPEPSPR